MSWQYNSRVFAQTGAAAHADQRILALADGSIFQGRSIAATSSCYGKIVFNTVMTGPGNLYRPVFTFQSVPPARMTRKTCLSALWWRCGSGGYDRHRLLLCGYLL
nr:carbamoyl-phosphate synthase domain-containing protein [Cardiobacterium valvarum]